MGIGVQGEDVKTFPKDTFEFAKTRIAGGDKELGLGSRVVWGDLIAWG